MITSENLRVSFKNRLLRQIRIWEAELEARMRSKKDRSNVRTDHQIGELHEKLGEVKAVLMELGDSDNIPQVNEVASANDKLSPREHHLKISINPWVSVNP